MRAVAAFVLVVAMVGCEKSKPTEPASREAAKGEPSPVPTPKAELTPKAEPAPSGKQVQQSPQFPPDDWTHKELAEYLGTKGVKVVVIPSPLHGRPGRVAAGFRPPGDDHTGIGVFLCESALAAKEEAGAMGEGGFSKGRFALGGPAGISDPGQRARCADFLRKIADALK